ncbi:MAG TPA: aminoacyl-tRNA hydrolase [Alphaproteobacteria bacterium]
MLRHLQAALEKLFSGRPVVSTKDAVQMWLIVGLGNPDSEHENNRHNIGFMAVDRIARDFDFGPEKNKFSGILQDGTIGGEKVYLLKPQTYMNLSGKSVAEAAKFYKIPADHIIAMHDELDLPLGKVRVKIGGGAAGHNGLKSIDASLGTQDYGRVRIGIGHPGKASMVSGYVLSDFNAAERDQMDLLVAVMARHIELLLKGRDADFMSKIANDTKEV